MTEFIRDLFASVGLVLGVCALLAVGLLLLGACLVQKDRGQR